MEYSQSPKSKEHERSCSLLLDLGQSLYPIYSINLTLKLYFNKIKITPLAEKTEYDDFI